MASTSQCMNICQDTGVNIIILQHCINCTLSNEMALEAKYIKYTCSS